MPQVIKHLASMFPSLPKSTITDALGKAGGNVDYALDALLMAKVIPGRIMPSRALVEQGSESASRLCIVSRVFKRKVRISWSSES